MNWLLRYARHCGISLAPDVPQDQALRSYVCDHASPAAWRLLCRSSRQDFLPILRHRRLGFGELLLYVRRLADQGWRVAPPARLLAHGITQSYPFFTSQPNAPLDERDLNLLWVAAREEAVSLAELALVDNWSDQCHVHIVKQHRWANLVRRARQWQSELQALLRHSHERGWHFFCGPLAWRGHELIPLRNSGDLWLEGVAMSSCLYKLRRECLRDGGSRFFSVRRYGRRVATLELFLERPTPAMKGADALFGRWVLQDLRQSYNRLPDALLVESLKVFAWQYTLWSRRPSRARPASPVVTRGSLNRSQRLLLAS